MSGDKIIKGLVEAVAGEHARETTIHVVEETYLGDGVYASFDGYQIKLRTPREYGDHVIYLDPPVYRAFSEWVKRLFPKG